MFKHFFMITICININKIMFSTLWPLAVGAVLFIVFVVTLYFNRRNLEKTMGKRAKLKIFLISRKLKVRYFTIFLLLTYFILPSVTTEIFGMFPCMNAN